MRLAIVIVLAVSGLLSTANNSCGAQSAWTYCEASTNRNELSMFRGPRRVRAGARGRGAAQPGRGVPTPTPTPECATRLCRGGYGVASLPDVTLADLASFVPERPAITGEPTGSASSACRPTSSRPRASSGRTGRSSATPSRCVSSPSLRLRLRRRRDPTGEHRRGPVVAAGQPDFTPTATSHVYTAAGTSP